MLDLIEQSTLTKVKVSVGLQEEKVNTRPGSLDNIHKHVENIPMNLKNLEQPTEENVVPFVNVKKQEVENSFNDVETEKSAFIAIDGPTIETANSIIFLPDEFTATEFGYKPINVSEKMLLGMGAKRDNLLNMLTVSAEKVENPMITVSDGYTDEIINQSSQENEIENQPQQENVVEDSSEFTYSEIKDENMPVPEVNVSEYTEQVENDNKNSESEESIMETSAAIEEQPAIDDELKNVQVEEYDTASASDDFIPYQETQTSVEDSIQQFNASEISNEEPISEETSSMTIELSEKQKNKVDENTKALDDILAAVRAAQANNYIPTSHEEKLVNEENKIEEARKNIDKDTRFKTYENFVKDQTSILNKEAKLSKGQGKEEDYSNDDKGKFIQITNIYEPEENKSEKGLAA